MISCPRVGLLLLSLTLYSCHDAPRENPFDPVSGDIRTLEGDFVIESQEDLDELIEQGGRAFQISGSLILQEPAFTSLEGLSNLIRVGGDLLIGKFGQPIDFLTSLHGLENLTDVGGTLYIGGHRSLMNLDGLQDLRNVSGDLSISRNPSLATTEGMNSLADVGGDIFVNTCPALRDLQALRHIKRAKGTVLLGNVGSDLSVGMRSLVNFSGLDSLQEVAGGLGFSHLPALESFAGLNGLKKVGGDVSITRVATTNLEGLESLTHVGGTVRISQNDNLEHLDGLNQLAAVGGDLLIGWATGNATPKSITEDLGGPGKPVAGPWGS